MNSDLKSRINQVLSYGWVQLISFGDEIEGRSEPQATFSLHQGKGLPGTCGRINIMHQDEGERFSAWPSSPSWRMLR